jgi:hypothetical protein
MASATPGTITGVFPVIASPALPAPSQPLGGKPLPQFGKSSAATAAAGPAVTGSAAALKVAKITAPARSDPQALVEQVNKFLNDSGRPDQFRVNPSSAAYIQEINPATGAVVAQYSASEFPALARSVGASGLLIDDIA